MFVSTKGRYALRIMMDLAENGKGGCLPLSEIAKRQEVSEKYLESIVSMLSREGLVDAQRGKSGGYRLTRPAEQCTVAEIIRATEKSYAPIGCLENTPNNCDRLANCRTIRMWEELYRRMDEYLSSVTVADLVNGLYERKDDCEKETQVK